MTTYDAKDPDTTFRRSESCARPKGAPNVLIILLDDVGFGATSAFGGPCDTPNFDKLAAGGLRYNRFHTTALCSPTRQALLTGRNHHSVGMGGITEIATAAPGLQLGAAEQQGAAGRDAQAERLLDRTVRQVPRGSGLPEQPRRAVRHVAHRRRRFEYFYGFIGGEDNQWDPALYEGTTPDRAGQDARARAIT